MARFASSPLARGTETVPNVPRLQELSEDPVHGLLAANDLTLQGWEGRPKWGFTPIDAYTVDVYWNNARIRAIAGARERGR